jgi:hypothetical protein
VEAGASGRSLADREVNRVRRASTGASVNAAKNRDSAEREGNRSRSGLRHERDGKRLEPLVELFQRAFSEDFVALRAPPENRSPRTRPKRLRAKRTCSLISASNAVRTKIPAHHDDFSAPSTGARSWTPKLSGFLPHYRRDFSYPDLRGSRMVGIFLIKEAYFYVDWLRVIPRCSSGGMSESEQGPRSLVRFHRGELVAGVIIAGDASIRRLSSSPVFHHETLARA